MKSFVKSIIDGPRDIKKEYIVSESSLDKWTDTQQRQERLNNRAINAFIGALSEKEYNHIRYHTSAQKI